jgi:hypothetical protein
MDGFYDAGGRAVSQSGGWRPDRRLPGRRPPSDGEKRRGRFERLVFAFMGPPDLGDPDEPAAEAPPRPAELCATCGRPSDEHEVVRSARLTSLRCPPLR